jgi:hypothetical protein
MVVFGYWIGGAATLGAGLRSDLYLSATNLFDLTPI